MSLQLQMKEKIICPNCKKTEANTPEELHTKFGLRIVSGKLASQSLCKNCRRSRLPKELREKYNTYKEQLKKDWYEKQGEKIKKEFDSGHDEIMKQLQNLKDAKTKAFEQLDSDFKNRLEKKKSELEGQIKQ